MSAISVSSYCLLLKNQECKVKKVVIDNDYMTFPYKIGGGLKYPYFKVCLLDSIKNISVKSIDLISKKKKCFKCGCLLDKKVCNGLQKWSKDKCRCECLKIKKCKTGYS